MRTQIILFTLVLMALFSSCKKDDDSTTPPLLHLQLGGAYVSNNAVLAINDTISFGVHAEGVSSNLTYFKVDVMSENGTSTIYDEGMNRKTFDATKIFFKGIPDEETFVITVMDYNRNTTSASFTVFRDTLSGFGPIYHFTNLVLGYQNNSASGHFLDPNTGIIYDDATVSGHESEVDIVVYFYLSSGSPSPTLVCPAQTDAQAQYPSMAGWPVQNATLYDYHTSDYDLISAAQFDECTSDSLLIAAYNPTYVNQKCKFALTGKIVPFLTAEGKKGLIKVVAADQAETGTMTIEIKIQQ
ncbi:MAG TPA: hypothetical protein PKY63_02440 [Bacteroidales bacterium]|nr:hypothetical protein [Bacteroidales bacterium]